jgi:hypothetical protein
MWFGASINSKMYGPDKYIPVVRTIITNSSQEFHTNISQAAGAHIADCKFGSYVHFI